jgi:lipopolysaccharide/colanic/teichoic acid biosynthesis glycosyltransferase
MTTPFLLQWLRQVGNDSNRVLSGSSTSIADESTFGHLLFFERRRAERSGRKLLLVLLRATQFSEDDPSEAAQRVADRLTTSLRDTDIIGWFEADQTLGILATEIRQIDTATIDIILGKVKGTLLQALGEMALQDVEVSYRILPVHGESGHVDPTPDVSRWDPSLEPSPSIYSALGKRVVDVVGSLLALIVLSPLFLILAVVVKLTSKGPVLFCQERLGLGGKRFCFLKFRTMYVNNDPEIHRAYVNRLIQGDPGICQGGNLYKLTHDPRITSAGRWLRKSSLDELPQFLNVLAGSMSLVGPRPPLPYEFDRYQSWHRRRVLELKPGLTGPWQVYGRSRTSFDEMVRMDLRYLKQRCFWTDCKILFRTPGAIISAEGAC